MRNFRYQNDQIRATIVRFYMTKKTTLSDEEMAQRGTHSCSPRVTRSLCACAAPSVQGRSNPTPLHNVKFLIANLELAFELSHRKQSLLKISNRKYFAILSLNPPPSYASSIAQPPTSNRNNQTIRNFTKPRSITTYAISNGTKSRFSGFALAPAFLLAEALPAI